MKYLIKTSDGKTGEAFRVNGDKGLVYVHSDRKDMESLTHAIMEDSKDYEGAVKLEIRYTTNTGNSSTGWREEVKEFQKCSDESCETGNA